MIGIVDYDAGNIKSVEKAVEFLGKEVVRSRDPEVLKRADHVIVPGVGAFKDAMERMEAYHLTEVIGEIAKSGTPILGICLGLQLFFDSSEEAPGVKGLGILPGKVVRFPEQVGFKIPHMGWNSIQIRENSRLLKGIKDSSYVYFVHSYYLQAEQEEDVAAKAEYMVPFHAAVEHENIYATQFHPEKSGRVGLQILNNFLEVAPCLPNE